MTDQQFTLLDELYFIQNVESLTKDLGWAKEEVIAVLLELFENDWLKVVDLDEEVEISKAELAEQITKYSFIASKKGLFAHNSN